LLVAKGPQLKLGDFGHAIRVPKSGLADLPDGIKLPVRWTSVWWC
jgi:hypothetical protein